MPAPVTSFDFTATNLSVAFRETTVGVVTNRLWNFGFSVSNVPQTSTDQNPTISFPSPGVYIVSLSCTNADGSNTYTREITVASTPSLNISIKDMVRAELPSGIAMDNVVFSQNIRKWQLLLQEGLLISDADVFNESKWPPLANVLIAKLIIYELILEAAQSSMVAFLSATQSFNQASSQLSQGTMLVADYEVPFDISTLFTGGATVTVNLLISNGISFGPSSPFTSASNMLSYLNGLGQGVFSFNNGKLQCLGNSNILTTFNYTHSVNGGTNGSFSRLNERVVPINTTIQVTSSTGGASAGPLKRIETGPTNAEWYDGSQYWSQMFRGGGSGGFSSSSSSSTGQNTGGVIGAIQSEACIYASKLGVYLPFCPNVNKVRLFQIGKITS